MENEVVVAESPRTQGAMVRTVHELVSNVARIQAAMATVMKDGTHYGHIPGTGKAKQRVRTADGKEIMAEVPRKTLLKPGVELLASLFHLALEPEVEDLSDEDAIRYRVKVRAIHVPTGLVLGFGIGEASTDEEKYRWRKAVCDEEWDEAKLEGRARVKWAKGERGSVYSVKQVRTEPADLANTVLKMGTKRGRSDCILTTTAASDIFTQDAEDLPDEVRREIYGDASTSTAEPPAAPAEKKDANPPAPAGREIQGSSEPDAPMAPAMLRLVEAAAARKNKTKVDVCAGFKVTRLEDLKARQINDVLAWIEQ